MLKEVILVLLRSKGPQPPLGGLWSLRDSSKGRPGTGTLFTKGLKGAPSKGPEGLTKTVPSLIWYIA